MQATVHLIKQLHSHGYSKLLDSIASDLTTSYHTVHILQTAERSKYTETKKKKKKKQQQILCNYIVRHTCQLAAFRASADEGLTRGGLSLPCLVAARACSLHSCSKACKPIHAFLQRASSLQAIAPIAAESLLNSNMAMHVHITCIRTLHKLRYLPSASLQASCNLRTLKHACSGAMGSLLTSMPSVSTSNVCFSVFLSREGRKRTHIVFNQNASVH